MTVYELPGYFLKSLHISDIMHVIATHNACILGCVILKYCEFVKQKTVLYIKSTFSNTKKFKASRFSYFSTLAFLHSHNYMCDNTELEKGLIVFNTSKENGFLDFSHIVCDYKYNLK